MPPLPPPRGPRPGRATRALLITVGVLSALLLIATVSLVVTVRSDDDRVAAGAPPSTTPPSTSAAPGAPPSTPGPDPSGPTTPPTTVDPTPPGPPPTPEELDAEIAELSEFVERERGLPFLEPVDVVLADEATFDQLLFADFDEGAESLAETSRILQALGLIDAGVDLDELLRQLLGAGVLGFYDPETGELVIRGQAITPYTRQTLVHELTHALDDQHFELDRPEYEDLDDETSFGFTAVLEGNARRIDSAYVASLSPADQARRDLEEQQFAAAGSSSLAGIPVILLKILQAPYEFGEVLVDDLVLFGGQELLDAAIDAPPSTSTQVLHVDAFLSGVGALVVEPPPADGEVVDEGMFGELMTRFTLEDSEDPVVAADAATGWAGDRFVTWADGEDSVCIRIDYVMEDDLELAELEDAYAAWAAPRGATVERVGADVLEVTSCSAAAGGSSPL